MCVSFIPPSRLPPRREMERLGEAALTIVFEYIAYSHTDVARACGASQRLRAAHVGAARFLWGVALPGCCGMTLAGVRGHLCGCVEQLLPPCAWVEALESEADAEATPRPESLMSCPILVAGSHALHALLSAQGPLDAIVSADVLARLPYWQPNDMDVWLVNRWNPRVIARWLARRIEATLRLEVSVCAPGPEHGAYGAMEDPSEEDEDSAPWNTYLHAMDGSSPHTREGRCAVTLVRDLHVRSPGGERLLKVSLIGTRAAPPRMRTCLQSLRLSSFLVPPLEPEEVLDRFDFDVCQVGYLPRDRPNSGPPEFLYAHEEAFWEALRLGRATVLTSAPPTPRHLQRRTKYGHRGFSFVDA